MPAPESAVQLTSVTASVTWLPSSSVTGGSSFSVVSFTVQPGTGFTLTKASGLSAGSCTRSDTVEAVSLSVGTRKVSSPKPPGAASVELTGTWAGAGAGASAQAGAGGPAAGPGARERRKR